VLRLVAGAADQFFTDAEVLQEIVHVYLARREWPAGQQVLLAFAELMAGRIASIEPGDPLSAAELAAAHRHLGSRDLLHMAVMRRLGVSAIVSTDRGFDAVPGIERLDPARFPEWRGTFGG